MGWFRRWKCKRGYHKWQYKGIASFELFQVGIPHMVEYWTRRCEYCERIEKAKVLDIEKYSVHFRPMWKTIVK